MKRNTDLHAQGWKKSVITFKSESKNVGRASILVFGVGVTVGWNPGGILAGMTVLN